MEPFVDGECQRETDVVVSGERRRFSLQSPKMVRKAVRFDFDGSPEARSEDEPGGYDYATFEDPARVKNNASKSRRSKSISDHALSMCRKITNSHDNNPTVVVRPNLRKKPTMPLFNPHTRTSPQSSHEPEPTDINSSPSSYAPSGKSMSPTSQVSTAPTSIFSNLSSPNSHSFETKQALDQTPCKTASENTMIIEEGPLPTIEESLPRYLEFPVQEHMPWLLPVSYTHLTLPTIYSV